MRGGLKLCTLSVHFNVKKGEPILCMVQVLELVQSPTITRVLELDLYGTFRSKPCSIDLLLLC